MIAPGRHGAPDGKSVVADAPLAATPLPQTLPSHATLNSLGDMNLSNQGSQHHRGVQLSILASTCALRTFWKPPLTSQNAHPTNPPPSRLCLAFTTDLYRTSTAERPRTVQEYGILPHSRTYYCLLFSLYHMFIVFVISY